MEVLEKKLPVTVLSGFLGSGNIEHSLKAMLKITSGLGEDHLTFNF